jgi:hypothetical protein
VVLALERGLTMEHRPILHRAGNVAIEIAFPKARPLLRSTATTVATTLTTAIALTAGTCCGGGDITASVVRSSRGRSCGELPCPTRGISSKRC